MVLFKVIFQVIGEEKWYSKSLDNKTILYQMYFCMKIIVIIILTKFRFSLIKRSNKTQILVMKIFLLVTQREPCSISKLFQIQHIFKNKFSYVYSCCNIVSYKKGQFITVYYQLLSRTNGSSALFAKDLSVTK